MTARAVSAAILVAAVLASGCIRHELSRVEVTSDAMAPQLGTATNLPDRFVVITPAATAGDCPPQLRDPGLHTMLRLQRSLMYPAADSAAGALAAVGDYAVEPAGRYGEDEGEGVRVECVTLRGIGLVRL